MGNERNYMLAELIWSIVISDAKIVILPVDSLEIDNRKISRFPVFSLENGGIRVSVVSSVKDRHTPSLQCIVCNDDG